MGTWMGQLQHGILMTFGLIFPVHSLGRWPLAGVGKRTLTALPQPPPSHVDVV